MEEKEIKISEEFIALNELAKKPESKNIEELVDKTFIIYKAEFQQGQFGEIAIISTDFGIYRTSSKVLIKQLKLIQAAMEQRKIKGVRVKLTKKKSAAKRTYYIFE
jgi:hypothetical protein